MNLPGVKESLYAPFRLLDRIVLFHSKSTTTWTTAPNRPGFAVLLVQKWLLNPIGPSVTVKIWINPYKLMKSHIMQKCSLFLYFSTTCKKSHQHTSLYNCHERKTIPHNTTPLISACSQETPPSSLPGGHQPYHFQAQFWNGVHMKWKWKCEWVWCSRILTVLSQLDTCDELYAVNSYCIQYQVCPYWLLYSPTHPSMKLTILSIHTTQPWNSFLSQPNQRQISTQHTSTFSHCPLLLSHFRVSLHAKYSSKSPDPSYTM